MPRENVCLLCGIRSTRCLLFPPRSTPRREGWFRTLEMSDDELRSRGGNYVCGDHFDTNDFDADGNLWPHAVPQLVASSLISEFDSEDDGFSDVELSDDRGGRLTKTENSAEGSEHALPVSSSPCQVGTSPVLLELNSTNRKMVDLVKQKHLLSRIKQEIKQNLHDAQLDPNQGPSSLSGNHPHVMPVTPIPLKISRNGPDGTYIAGASTTASSLDDLPAPSQAATQDGLVSGSSSDHDCPVCLQPFSHPVKLPCSHIFCFLCAKGFANQHGRCAFCRAPIPQGYMDLPVLVPEKHRASKNIDSKFAWYYEGRNGWWQFEERLSDELEEALEHGKTEHELQIAGFIYVIDMQRMVQYRKDHPTRTRRIKRDHFAAPRKGIAGLQEDLINGTIL
ncbi:E3 ubiquitin-protein ligase RNF146-like [Tropilaelaps mercedesae]|uniref:E3 ubiquitin-protein ligase n=1 Tax=Tropilaelaps mercedesae TaxID=418985 RepID=A0A1V9XRK7_9ACAR|nr:E3 ubiquitin-protein ligase RNF146-like [Tropilaelaps mercedesae]